MGRSSRRSVMRATGEQRCCGCKGGASPGSASHNWRSRALFCTAVVACFLSSTWTVAAWGRPVMQPGFVCGGSGAWTRPSATARRGARRARTEIGMVTSVQPRQQTRQVVLPPPPPPPPGQEGPELPWRQSVAGPEHPLSYMPFLEHLLGVLAQTFELEALPVPEELSFASNDAKKARILSMAFTSPEIRRVRFTYFDAGSNVQVLNAVVYPDPSLDMPVLGVDLISFGKKHLAGIDFQPIFDEEEYKARHAAPLAPIKARYPEFAQQMSQRFYDSARFFSEGMLFGRYEDPSVIQDRLFPAFAEYVSTYVDALQAAAARPRGGGPPPVSGWDARPASRARVLDRQRAYDQYNAERDPAHGLFVNYFGQEWSDSFMDDFLFPLSVRPEGGYPKGPPPGCGGPPGQRKGQEGQGQQQAQAAAGAPGQT